MLTEVPITFLDDKLCLLKLKLWGEKSYYYTTENSSNIKKNKTNKPHPTYIGITGNVNTIYFFCKEMIFCPVKISLPLH